MRPRTHRWIFDNLCLFHLFLRARLRILLLRKDVHQDRKKQDLYQRFVSILLKRTRIQPHTEALNHAQTNMQAILTVFTSSHVNWGTFATTSRVCAWI